MAINSAIANITSNECESIETMAQSAAKIAFHNFKWQFVTLVLFNTTLMCGVNAFLRSFKKNTIVANDMYIPLYSRRSITRQYVIFGTNLDSILHLLTWMERRKFDNTADHLIICQSKGRDNCDEVIALQYLWERRIMSTIFINDVFHNGTSGYYYEYGEECRNTPPIKVADWDSCVSTNISSYCAGKFPLPFHNMYGCPLIVSTFFQPPYMYITDGMPSGADGDLLKIIIQALNATLVIKTPSRGDGWGNLDENGTWVGCLGDLYFDLANISMASAAITHARYTSFELSIFYYTTTIVWITHPPTLEPSSYKLLRPFKVDARIALGLSFLFVVILALFFRTNFCTSLCHIINAGRLPDSVIFSAWKMCMGQAVTVVPLKMTTLYLILFWIWYCFLVRTFYQVHLINSLKTDVYSQELLTIEDAIAEGYSFGGGPALREYYVDSPLVYRNWEGRDSSEYKMILLNISQGMKYVLAVNVAMVRKFLRKPGSKLQILPQTVICSPIGIFLKKYSPLTEVINRKLTHLFEFGFPEKIFKNNTDSGYVEKPTDENKPIKLIHFTGCYILLLVGWVLSFILFLIELYVNRQRKPTIRFSN
ncbi:uncharacterized protein LOC112056379 [Bicyclus anynana]|uniref:Uncharacterized protein LOC112056379 n=1 Tax=Bicyclus anynana TaxID=110368 RepID=A0A6J1NY95_BICAN|nr:uncharacterized protein LOC112056379 [Bicyclus anynana]